MAAGLGAFAVAGLGTLFLCVMIPTLNLFSADRPRTMQVEIIGEGMRLRQCSDRAPVAAEVGDWLARCGLEPSHASRYTHEFGD